MTTKQPHPQRCETCENTDCEYWEETPHMSAGHDQRTGWRASPGVITFVVGCASHSSSRPAPAGKSTVVEDITFEGAAIVQAARKEAYEQGCKDAREKALEYIFERLVDVSMRLDIECTRFQRLAFILVTSVVIIFGLVIGFIIFPALVWSIPTATPEIILGATP